MQYMNIDRVDRAIIDQLSQDARLSNVALAERVNLTPGPCLRRVQRLEKEGVILGYEAVLNPKTTGQAFEVMVEISLSNFDRDTVTRFEAELSAHAEIIELYRLFGSPDYFVRVAVPDAEAYETFLSERILTAPGISTVSSRFAMKVLKSLRPGATPPAIS